MALSRAAASLDGTHVPPVYRGRGISYPQRKEGTGEMRLVCGVVFLHIPVFTVGAVKGSFTLMTLVCMRVHVHTYTPG